MKGGDTMEKLYTIKELAEYFNVSKDTIWRWIRNNELNTINIGGRKRVKESDLQAFIDRGGNNERNLG